MPPKLSIFCPKNFFVSEFVVCLGVVFCFTSSLEVYRILASVTWYVSSVLESSQPLSLQICFCVIPLSFMYRTLIICLLQLLSILLVLFPYFIEL